MNMIGSNTWEAHQGPRVVAVWTYFGALSRPRERDVTWRVVVWTDDEAMLCAMLQEKDVNALGEEIWVDRPEQEEVAKHTAVLALMGASWPKTKGDSDRDPRG